MQNLKVAVVYKENSGCDYHRLITPFADFPKGVDIRWLKYGDTFPEEYFDVDVVIFNRTFGGGGVDELLALKRKYGFNIVVDLDDYWKLFSKHHLSASWKQFNTEQKIIDHVDYADCVFVTNYLLYEKVKELFPSQNVHIIKNAINFEIPQFKTKREFTALQGTVNFGYASSPSHLEDLKAIQNLFVRLGSDGKWKREGEFTLGGYENHPIFMEKIRIVKPAQSVSVCPILPLQEYMKFYNSCDVAIAPLVNNEFNTCKSNLKFLEAGADRMPFVCSWTYPYRLDMGMADKGIKFCDSVNEWFRAFKFFLENRNAIIDYGEANYESVKEDYNMKIINEERLQILNTYRR